MMRSACFFAEFSDVPPTESVYNDINKALYSRYISGTVKGG